MRRKLFAIGLALIVGLVCVAILEVAVRLSGRFPRQGTIVVSPSLGWVPERGFSQIGEDGAEPTVVFLGDSFTQPTKGYVRSFYEDIKTCVGELKVVNLGGAGYGTAQEYEAWKAHGAKRRPDVTVLAVFLWNDLADNLNDIYYSYLANDQRPSYEVIDGELQRAPSPERGLWYALTARSALARAFEVVANSLGWADTQLTSRIDQYSDFYEPDEGPRARRGWELTERLILAVRDDVESTGSRFLLVGFDNAFTVEPELYDQLAREHGELFRDLDMQLPSRKLKAFAQANGIEYVDLTTILQDHKKKHPDEHLYRLSTSGHFTKTGVDVAGQAIARAMRERELVQCSARQAKPR